MHRPTDTLRARLEGELESGGTLLGVSRDTGVARASLRRFLAGFQLASDAVDALAWYYGLTLKGD